FHTRIETDDIVKCDFSQRPFVLEPRNNSPFRTHSVIIATGANAKWLGLESEQRLANKGVSACAVCDGALPLFRNQPLAVVGGGDTAMEETSYLAKFGSKIHLVHRRGEFRASKAMQKRVLSDPKVDVLWHHVVTDILGQTTVEGVRIKDVRSGHERDLPA